jgi:hypothetical protein
MTRTQSYENWVGTDAYDPSGDKIGEITDVFYDDVTGRPEWVAIKTGLFGTKTSLVPLQASSTDSQGRLVLNYTKAQVKDAPNFDPDYGTLGVAEERMLWKHYGYNWELRDKDYGYGRQYLEPRADKDFTFTASRMSERERPADEARLQRYRFNQ